MIVAQDNEEKPVKTIKNKVVTSREKVKLEEIKRQYNYIDSVRYFTAINQYNRQFFDSCVSSIGPLNNEPSSDYYESGLLLAAKAYTKLNNKYLAEQNLQKVIQLNGKLKQEAQELLNKL
jgi:exonuclease VII small subunit